MIGVFDETFKLPTGWQRVSGEDSVFTYVIEQSQTNQLIWEVVSKSGNLMASGTAPSFFSAGLQIQEKLEEYYNDVMYQGKLILSKI